MSRVGLKEFAEVVLAYFKLSLNSLPERVS